MRRRTLHLTALTLTAAAVAPGVAGAADVDLRMPDTRDAAARAQVVDLRSPDARDAAAGRDVSSAPRVVFVKSAAPSPAADHGIAWGDVGLGAGGLAVIVGLGAAGAFASGRRLRPARTPHTPAMGR